MKLKFEYGSAKVRDLEVVTEECEQQGLPRVKSIRLNGDRLTPTNRFWRSLFHRFRISESIFRYFSYEEVFDRISKRTPCERFRYCIEIKGKGIAELLAVSSPDRPVIGFGDVDSLVKKFDGLQIKYSNGVVSSTHVPASGDGEFHIGGDAFKNRYVLETPIDGYGMPKIHLSLLRMTCSNGAIGYSRAFRSQINTGKDPLYSISRALTTYDNDNGYAALWQRFESAQKSWASLRETQQLYNLLANLTNRGGVHKVDILKRFYQLSGRPHELYGLANLDALTQKRQRVLPAKCRVYDLLNFASEVATHEADPHAGMQLQAFIGTLVSDEYDMEGTAEKVTDFQDFFLNRPGRQTFSDN